jgi:uncharacterized protein (DUF924 family)
MKKPDDVLNFWFGELTRPTDFPVEKSNLWFKKSQTTDRLISETFMTTWEAARKGQLDQWAGDIYGRLSLIIVLDQFSRNLRRDHPEAFSQDAKALKLVQGSIKRNDELILFPIQRVFFYLPLEHAEDRASQELSVAMYTKLLSEVPAQMKSAMREFLRYAEAHKSIIEKFGRFPHRNRILGRESTSAEIEFLKGPNSSF